jgi:hypothetical protein
MLHAHLYVAVIRRTKQAKPGNLPTRNAVAEIEEHWKEKYLVFKGLTAVVTSAFHRVFLVTHAQCI